MSTFLVEVDENTFAKNGLESLSEVDSKHFCETVFSDQLSGHPLVVNRSLLRQFPKVRNERWSHENIVLLGDALHTAHFSIGSGTRFAMEDAIALAKAVTSRSDISAAFKEYETKRRPILEKLIEAADASAAWYETFPQRMIMDPMSLAMSYATRSGRVDRDRLRMIAPKFVAECERIET